MPCFPFETIMLALGRSHVDYFSLDVEGVELDVLRTIPFERISMDVLSLEYSHGKDGKKAMAEFMGKKGFRVHKDIRFSKSEIKLYVDDFIFVRKSGPAKF